RVRPSIVQHPSPGKKPIKAQMPRLLLTVLLFVPWRAVAGELPIALEAYPQSHPAHAAFTIGQQIAAAAESGWQLLPDVLWQEQEKEDICLFVFPARGRRGEYCAAVVREVAREAGGGTLLDLNVPLIDLRELD